MGIKKIQIVSQYHMKWFNYIHKVFNDWHVVATSQPVHDADTDIMMFMWADKFALDFINNNEKKCKYVVVVRAYEFYQDWWTKLDWGKIDLVCMVNTHLAKMMKYQSGIEPFIFYNGVDPAAWEFTERTHGKDIAMVAFLHQKKNHPLAMQVMAKLPRDYTLHLAGGLQQTEVLVYMDNFARDNKINIKNYGQVEDIAGWLKDKQYIISTSFREGSPNNVVEAMAMGIKPVVHNWPGAKDQFGPYVFDTVDQAVEMILPTSDYDSKEYRNIIETRLGLNCYQSLKEQCERLR